MVYIKTLGKSDSEWFDVGTHLMVSGAQYSIGLSDKISGDWIFDVKISSDGRKATVGAGRSEGTTSVHNQIKNKTIVLEETNDGRKFYSVLGIGYVNNGRFQSERVSSLDDLVDELRSKFDIRKHQDVSSHPSNQLRDKLVALVEKNDPEKMVLLFFLQKIRPVFV